MSQDKRKWTVDGDGAAISSELHRSMGVSHRQAKGLVDARCVTVNGEPVATHGHRLKAGDEVEVSFNPGTTYHELPRPSKTTDQDVRVLWEDKHLVFVDKPAGLLSVPTEHSNDDSLADALAEHYRRKGIKRPRVYIVHRLDRFTTGVIVFARTPEALAGLKDIFFEHSLNRIYKAILVGELPENSGTLYDKVAERTRRLRMIVVASRTGAPRPKDAKPAVTHYRVIERLPGHTVVELKLETGRRNQIRVQFSERGFPILGDKIYGSTSQLIGRQALHAEVLGLRHPVTEENVVVQSAIPGDMEKVLQRLRTLRRVDRAKAGLKGEEGIFKPRAPWEDRDGDHEEAGARKRPGMGVAKDRRGESEGRARPARPYSDRPRKEDRPSSKDRYDRDDGEGRGRRDGAPDGFRPRVKRRPQAEGGFDDARRKPSQHGRGENQDRARPARPYPDRPRKEGHPSKDRDGRGSERGGERGGEWRRDAGPARGGPRPERRFASPGPPSEKRPTERRGAKPAWKPKTGKG